MRERFHLAEDDVGTRTVLIELLSTYGHIDTVVNGSEAVCLFGARLERNQPHALVFLDIMMPDMDGRKALKEIRALEAERGIQGHNAAKIVMLTSLKDKDNVFGSFREHCDAYIVKPVDQEKVRSNLVNLGLIR